MKKEMEYKIKIQHQAGSRNGQTEEFAVTGGDVTIGRTGKSSIRYDPDLDDMVSREHAVISIDAKEADTFWIKDLNSTNGLSVNGKKVTGSVKIFAGDRVQVGGRKGPVFTFDLDPRPESHIKKTQEFDIPPPTGEYERPTLLPPEEEKEEEEKPLSRKSAEQMMIRARRKSGMTTWLVAAGILLLMIAGGVGLYRIKSTPPPVVETVPKPKTPMQIAAENSDKVVLIEMAWKLVLVNEGGKDVYHMFTMAEINGRKRPAGLFRRVGNNKYEPMLTTSTEPYRGVEPRPIQGNGSGTGFVVSQDGHILTCRHVAANWQSWYSFPSGTFPGTLVETNKNGDVILYHGYVDEDDVKQWVPLNAENLNNKNVSKVVEGVNIYMDVTFARTDLRTPARVVRISDKHDASMIKIDLPQALPYVELMDNYSTVQTGEEVTLLGYPAISPNQYSTVNSQDVFNDDRKIVTIPVPTLSQGNIGRLIKADSKTSSGSHISPFGDSYQLTINSSGPGNSGGPLFDNLGRVIGIFNAEIENKISFAVPVRYGIELMRTDAIIESR